MTYLSSFVCLFMAIGIYCNDKIPLSVLLLLPYPDSRPNSGWDRGLELLPAARVAVNQINNDDNVLPGYELKLIEKQSEACSRTILNNGLNNFVGTIFHGSQKNNTVAILGLVCSTVTEIVSSLASRDEVSLIQLAMANSDNLRNPIKFLYLWRMISSVRVIINVAIMLMEKFNWNNFAQIYDRNDIFYQNSATLFRDIVHSTPNYTLLADEAIVGEVSSIQSALNVIQTTRVRIIFVSVTSYEGRMLICEAAKRNMIWPSYTWVFHSQTFDELRVHDPECTIENYYQAVENVIILDLALESRTETDILVSGQSYGEYLTAYNIEKDRVQNEFKKYLIKDNVLKYNKYCNVMYDQVWSLAVALNASLPTLHNRGLALERYRLNNTLITEIINSQLETVEFTGASARIRFNEFREVTNSVHVYLVRDNVSFLIGEYHGNMTTALTLYNVSLEEMPDDEFVMKYDFFGSVATIILLFLSSLMVLLITSMLFCTIVFYNTPEVRAASPLLTLMLFVGCYMVIFGILVAVIRHVHFFSKTSFTALCLLERLLIGNAYVIISSTILLRIVRVYKIFTHFGKLSGRWKDKFLLIYIILFCIPYNLIQFVWITIEHLSYTEQVVDVNPPFVIVFPYCSSENEDLFRFLISVYEVSLSFVILIFAIRTRKIDRKHFKDTKKLIFMSYCFFIMLPVASLHFKILQHLQFLKGAMLLSISAHLLSSALLFLFLLLPKIFPLLLSKVLLNSKVNLLLMRYKIATDLAKNNIQ